MNKRKQQKENAIIFWGIAERVQNLTVLKSTPFIATPDGNFYEVDGERIPSALYEAQYPTEPIPKTVTLSEATTGKRNW